MFDLYGELMEEQEITYDLYWKHPDYDVLLDPEGEGNN